MFSVRDSVFHAFLLGPEVPGIYPNVRASGVVTAGTGQTQRAELSSEGPWVGLASCREARGTSKTFWVWNLTRRNCTMVFLDSSLHCDPVVQVHG